MNLADLVPEEPRFRTQEEVRESIRDSCAASEGLASFHELGESEEGRPIYGAVLGRGGRAVSLIAGAHADEPVGPETLRTFVLKTLRRRNQRWPLLEAFRFVVVFHVNPDGEAANRGWMAHWPDADAYVRHVSREVPGRDVEFGFPEMRLENRVVSEFLRAQGPFALHLSLHGMAVAEGAQLLIARRWAFRTQALREDFARAVHAAGLGLHDHNRKGEKGFFYLEPGFSTTPESEAMRDFFRARGDREMAARFHKSSMEFVASLGGDPLCLVTEIPLFVISGGKSPPGLPARYLALREKLPELALKLRRGESIRDEMQRFGVRPVPVATAMHLQLEAIRLGCEAIR